MCGKCLECQNQTVKPSENYKFAFAVLILITCTSLGLSCYAVVKVQILSQELDHLQLVKRRVSAETRISDLNNPNSQIDAEEVPFVENYLLTTNDFNEVNERNIRSLSAENSALYDTTTQTVFDAKGGDTSNPTQGPYNLLKIQKNPHSIKKKAVDYEENSESESFTPEYRNIYRHRARGGRNNNQLEIISDYSPQAGRLKFLAAVHFSGDTSKYVYGQHTNFNGNGHLRHPKKTFVDWKESDWVESIGTGNGFDMRNGLVTVKESGLYFVYSQIYYLDEHDVNGYRVYKNSDILLQCTVTSHSSERMLKGNTCYSAGVTYLESNDNISVSDINDGRYSLFEPGKSFFGMIRLGDTKTK